MIIIKSPFFFFFVAVVSLTLSCAREVLPVSLVEEVVMKDEHSLGVWPGELMLDIPEEAIVFSSSDWISVNDHLISFGQNPFFTERRDTVTYLYNNKTIKLPFVQNGLSTVIGSDELVVKEGLCSFSVVHHGSWNIAVQCEGVTAIISPGSGQGVTGVSMTLIGTVLNPEKSFLIFEAQDESGEDLPILFIPLSFSVEDSNQISLVPGSCTYKDDRIIDGMDFVCDASWVSFSDGKLQFDENPCEVSRKARVFLTSANDSLVYVFSQGPRVAAMDTPVCGIYPSAESSLPAVKALYPYNVRISRNDEDTLTYSFFRSCYENEITIQAELSDSVIAGAALERVVIKRPNELAAAVNGLKVLSRKNNTVWIAQESSPGEYGSVLVLELI